LLFKGIDLFYSNNILLAIKYLELAKLYTKEKKDLLLITNNLGLFYGELGKYNKANIYFNENIKRAVELGDSYYKNESEFNLLLNDYEIKDSKTTLKTFWSFYHNLENKTIIEKFEYLNIFFELNNENNNTQPAKILRNYLYQNFNITDFTSKYIGYFYYNNAVLEKNLGNYKNALKYTDSSYYISKTKLSKEEVLEDFYNYKEIYEQKKDFNTALKYSDSIQIIEKQLSENKLTTSLAIIDENLLFNKLKGKVDKKITNYNYIILGFSSFFGLLIIFLIRKNKNTKNKSKQLSKELLLSESKFKNSIKENIEFKRELKAIIEDKDFYKISKLKQQI